MTTRPDERECERKPPLNNKIANKMKINRTEKILMKIQIRMNLMLF